METKQDGLEQGKLLLSGLPTAMLKRKIFASYVYAGPNPSFELALAFRLGQAVWWQGEGFARNPWYLGNFKTLT
jgi:hypothetical protein